MCSEWSCGFYDVNKLDCVDGAQCSKSNQSFHSGAGCESSCIACSSVLLQKCSFLSDRQMCWFSLEVFPSRSNGRRHSASCEILHGPNRGERFGKTGPRYKIHEKVNYSVLAEGAKGRSHGSLRKARR